MTVDGRVFVGTCKGAQELDVGWVGMLGYSELDGM